jgi:isoleucyl-tRNA synthetase
LRRKEKLKVRQPLAKIMVPLLNPHFREQFDAIKDIVLTEVNVKEVEYLYDTAEVVKKKIKPNFKTLGPKYGKMMKEISGFVGGFGQKEIGLLEQEGSMEIEIAGQKIIIGREDVEIMTEDIPGWTVATEGQLTIALDIDVTDELKQEGVAREFINKIQNLRKESRFEVTDRINIKIEKHNKINDAVFKHKSYICAQTLAVDLQVVDELNEGQVKNVEISDDVTARMTIEKQP